MQNRFSALGRKLSFSSWILPILVCSFWVLLTINFQWRVSDLGVHTQAVWSCAYEKPLAITLYGGMFEEDNRVRARQVEPEPANVGGEEQNINGSVLIEPRCQAMPALGRRPPVHAQI